MKMNRFLAKTVGIAVGVCAVFAASFVNPNAAVASGSVTKSCVAKNIKMTLGPTYGATGTTIQVIAFRNSGKSDCYLAGNPEIGFIAVPGSSPEYEAVPIATLGEPRLPVKPHKVVVKPDHSASVSLFGGDIQVDNGPDVTWQELTVALPGGSLGTTFRKLVGSYRGFSVSAFASGSGGNPNLTSPSD